MQLLIHKEGGIYISRWGVSCPENGYSGSISESTLTPYTREKSTDPPLYPSLYIILNIHNTQYGVKNIFLKYRTVSALSSDRCNHIKCIFPDSRCLLCKYAHEQTNIYILVLYRKSIYLST